MTRTKHLPTLQALAVAGLVSVATVVTSPAAAAQSVTPEWALINFTASAHNPVTVPSSSSRLIDGLGALLNRSTAQQSTRLIVTVSFLEDDRPIDGERALLNRVAQPEKGRLTLAQ